MKTHTPHEYQYGDITKFYCDGPGSVVKSSNPHACSECDSYLTSTHIIRDHFYLQKPCYIKRVDILLAEDSIKYLYLMYKKKIPQFYLSNFEVLRMRLAIKVKDICLMTIKDILNVIHLDEEIHAFEILTAEEVKNSLTITNSLKFEEYF